MYPVIDLSKEELLISKFVQTFTEEDCTDLINIMTKIAKDKITLNSKLTELEEVSFELKGINTLSKTLFSWLNNEVGKETNEANETNETIINNETGAV